MTNEATKQTLAQLGVNSPEKIPAMFAELRAEFDRELSAATDEANWKSVRDAWLGRKSGVLSYVTDNWLKPAAPDLKRVVGQELNQIKHTWSRRWPSGRLRLKRRLRRRRKRASASIFRFPVSSAQSERAI